MIRTKIAGIPCQIKVTSFVKEVTDRGTNYDIEFAVYDGRGYKAAWLERKLTDSERERIEKEIIQFHLNGNEI